MALRTFSIPKSLAGKRWDLALSELCPDLTRSRIQKLVRKGGLRVDGRPLSRTNGKVQGGETVRLEGADPPPLEVLHQDKDLIVLVKPAGLLTHATQANETDTLAEYADTRFGPLPIGKGPERPGIVHRLDRETSGVMLVARTDNAMLELEAQFKARTVSKTYRAYVTGEINEEEFEVDSPIEGAAPGSDRQRIAQAGRGKIAQTGFRVLERFGHYSLLECRPVTGRRHQIRVHLFSQRIQILGDSLYRVREAPKPEFRVPRMALHATRIRFRHPTTEAELDYSCPDPPDLARLREQLKAR